MFEYTGKVYRIKPMKNRPPIQTNILISQAIKEKIIAGWNKFSEEKKQKIQSILLDANTAQHEILLKIIQKHPDFPYLLKSRLISHRKEKNNKEEQEEQQQAHQEAEKLLEIFDRF